MASDIQISSNRANSRLSTGPSLAARAHTRYNGLKTGIRFRGEFLPTERPEEFQERVAFWTRSLKPRNAGERELVFKYVRAEWVHARAERALGARIYTQDAQAGDRADAGVEKDLRLLYWDRRGPLCMYALSNAVSDRLQTSWTPEIDDPIEPSVVLKSLEGSAKGCERLIGEWKALAGRLENGRAWQPHEKLKSIRLMGKQPVDAVGDDRVLLVYAATFALGPIGRKGAFEDLRCDMGAMEYERFVERIRSQEELLPVSGADAPGACVALLDLVARNVERLEAKLEAHREHAEEAAELASDHLGYDDSPEGQRLQRHELACHRRMERCLDAFWKYRRMAGDEEDDGGEDCLGLETGAAEVVVEDKNVTTEANLEASGGGESGAVAVEHKNVTTEANLGTDVTEVVVTEIVETSAREVDGGVLGAIQPNSTRGLGHAADARTIEEAIMARGALLRPIE